MEINLFWVGVIFFGFWTLFSTYKLYKAIHDFELEIAVFYFPLSILLIALSGLFYCCATK